MAERSIFRFVENDRSIEGRAIGAIINNRIRIPLLKALYELGEEQYHFNKEIFAYLSDRINLEKSDIQQLGSGTEFEYRMKWALNTLKNAELITKDQTQYLSWKISDKGLKFIKSYGLTEGEVFNDDTINIARKEISKLYKENRKTGISEIRYWALGFGAGKWYERLEKFKEDNYWQALDYELDDVSNTAERARDLFTEIEIGDFALIKGLGGRSDLKVHYVGEVIAKNQETNRIDFRKRNVQLYNDKAPSGEGAGNWFNTILEVTRQADIQLLYFQSYKIELPGKSKKKKSDLPSFYKYSYGDLAIEMIDIAISRQLILIKPSEKNQETSEDSSMDSVNQFQFSDIGDFVYSCWDSNKVLLIGKIRTELERCEIPELDDQGWQQKRYDVVVGAKVFKPYSGPEFNWTPKRRPHFAIIPPADYGLANEHIIKPYFTSSVDKIINGEDIDSQIVGAGSVITLDRNVAPVLDVDIIAQELIKVINLLEGNTGQMLGVFGSWGRGKTFFMERMCRHLGINYKTGGSKKEGKFYFLKFHAWKYQDTDAIWAYLYGQVAKVYFSHLNKDTWDQPMADWRLEFPRKIYFNFRKRLNSIWLLWKLNKARNGLREIRMILISWGFFVLYHIYLKDYLISMFPSISDFIEFIKWIIGVFGIIGFILLIRKIYQLGKQGKRIVQLYTERPDFKEHLGLQAEIQEELKYLLKAWIKTETKSKDDGKGKIEWDVVLKEGEKRLLIFVDDIDRCQENKIIQVVDALRVMLEDEDIALKVVVLAAIDEQILERTILWKYGDLLRNEKDLIDNNKLEEKRPEDLVKEYMDKLFIAGVKLPPLSEKERTDVIENYVRESELISEEPNTDGRLKRFNIPSGELTIEELEKLEEDLDNGMTDSELKQKLRKISERQNEIQDLMHQKQKISTMELETLKTQSKQLHGGTPRQLRILLYRFILAKNLALAQRPTVPINSEWSNFIIMEIVNKTNEGKNYKFDSLSFQVITEIDEKVKKFTPKILEIVVPY